MLCLSSVRQKQRKVFCQFLCDEIHVYSCQQINNKKVCRNWQYAKLFTRSHCVTAVRKAKNNKNTDHQTKIVLFNIINNT